MNVQDIMVQRTQIEAYPATIAPAELLEEMLDGRYTRVPVYDESIDRVLGLVHLKDVIKLVRSEGKDLGAILKPVLRVPERKPILRLLADMQRAFCHVALVKDEFGVTLGLVTQEDILEEIVGEIRDEFDSEELFSINKLGDGSYEVLGRVSVLDFNRAPPPPGPPFHYELTCVDVSGSRIARARVTRLESTEKGEAEGQVEG